MIEKERIERIKSAVDLLALAEARGIRMQKSGKSYLGLCPFHEDKTPSFSITPVKNEWHCFGCGKGGDAIKFVELFDKVDFKEAVRRLSDGGPMVKTEAPEGEKPGIPEARQYLERTVAIYAQNFLQKESGRAYLSSRGITDAGLFEKHKIGLSDGTLNTILPDNGGVREVLTRIGILLKDGRERFEGCVVFPVCDTDGPVVTLYGRNMDPASGKKHLFLPHRPTGLWNSPVIRTSSEIILTEAVLDALSVRMAGFPNVVAIQGVNSLSEREIMEMKIHGVRRIVLLLDGDEAGRKASESLARRLRHFEVEIRTLPDGHDPNSYLQAFGPQKLAALIRPGEAVTDDKPSATGFAIACGLRQYHILGLEKGPRRLKATVRLSHGGKLHVDTLDFYSARSRRILAQDLCRVFEELPETIEADLARLVRECEDLPAAPAEPAPTFPVMSDEERAEAERFGRSCDLIQQILADFETCGLIGENENKLLGYIAMTSRKRKEPISVQILASSGSGKSALQDAVVEFCPPEDLVKLTSLSGKALFYKDRTSLKHKVLALEEGDGAEDASYAIRSLISAGVLTNETTIKDLATGRLTTMENQVEGPTVVFYTTTNPDVDPETKSRFFVTGIDESREQTRRILAFQRAKHCKDENALTRMAEAVIQKHRNFQRLLKPLSVRNPYSDQLTYGDDRLQGRRDQPKYLNLIKAVAFLRQMRKTVHNASIDVDPEDIRIANTLAQEILGRSLSELSRPGRDLLLLLDEMIEKRWRELGGRQEDEGPKRTDISFTRRDIREHTGWSNTRVHRYLKELIDLEYVLVDSGKNGLRCRYRLAYEGQGKNGEKFILGLTQVTEQRDGC